MNAHSSTLVSPLRLAAQVDQQDDVLDPQDYMPMVHTIARRVYRQVHIFAEMGDLISLGVIGLMDAIKRYDPTRSASFKTFAYYRVRGAMLDGVGEIAPLSRKAYRALPKDNRPHVAHAHARLEQPVLNRQESRCPVEHTTPECLASSRQDKIRLMKAMRQLSVDQQELLKRHYWEEKNLRAAGAELGISRSWACRSHARALSSLRTALNDEPKPQDSVAGEATGQLC